MKTFLVLIFSMIFFFNSYSQIKLPTVGTTLEEAISDLGNNITNEKWFKYNDDDGNMVYTKLFKGTPVGINHSLTEFQEIVKDYNLKDCFDKSIFSNIDKNRDGSINYEMLANSLKRESAEISKYCTINDIRATKILLVSTVSEFKASLAIKIFTKSKD